MLMCNLERGSLKRQLDASFGDLGGVVANHLLNASGDRPPRLPSQDFLGSGRIRAAFLGIIDRHRPVNDLDFRRVLDTIFLLDLLYNITNRLGEIENCELFSGTNVDRASLVRVHEHDEAVNEIVNVLEGTGLHAVSVDSHILATKSLKDEIGHHTSIKRIHARPYPTSVRENTDSEYVH